MAEKRKPNAIRSIDVFNYDDNPVKVWFVKQERTICFRRKGSRKVLRITTRELFEKLTGQIVMPFV